MKRRDFIKTIGISCIGSCFNPLNVLAAETTSLKSLSDYKATFPPTRLNPFRTSPVGITSLDNMTYAPEPLLEAYDKKKEARRALYLQLFGENEIDDILDEMRDSYEALIPTIPYIGEFNFNLQWFIPNAQKLAEYLVVKDYGITQKKFSNMHLTQAAKDLLVYPRDALLAAGKAQFGPAIELQMRAWAMWSQFRTYPEDYIYYFRKGDGVDFDWGFDYMRCPNVLLYEKYDARDLVLPMICTQDDMAGSAMGTGYHRTMQIATGDPFCDLRWKLQE